ncbi:MAG: hypothetical protein A2287_01325 [Candidatus Melainabacteria bacterium RIFOXYA12_FULL_32_12]|nr:MAG: hypothetical protein A2255_01120 [Candidatus Melainabacteria bacterium RIFOXYA2_FULL_32_9]OGI28361.1 MAG: hypothetical protein A2287_01325 [Candidatus Melainabacteria bacterium RIFOXYA12_FULL_32_12]
MRKVLAFLLVMIFACPGVIGQEQTPAEKQLKPLMPNVGIDGKLEVVSDSQKDKLGDKIEYDINVSADNKVEDKDENSVKTIKMNDTKKKKKRFSLFKIKKDKPTEDKSEIKAENLNQKKPVDESIIEAKNKVNNENSLGNNIEKPQNESKQPEVKVDNALNQENKGQPENKQEEIISKKSLTYSDLDIQKIADEIKDELDDEEAIVLSDLRILWQAAVEKSETIRFAILKLSNPNGEEEKKNMVKKILTPLTSVAPLIGVGSGDPVAGGSAILGGGLLSSLLADDSLINNQLSRVTDVDLVVMAQEIDSLQQKLVILYYNYLGSLERLKLIDETVNNRYKYYEAAHALSTEVLSVADVFYREALDVQYKARQEVLTARAALEQLVGNEALIQVDKEIHDRLY